MAILQYADQDFLNTNRITNLPASVANGQPVTHEQLQSLTLGLSWKDSVRVASAGNISLSAPGATIDGISMAAGDRVLLRGQTTAAQNGIYVWSGASSPLVRSPDSNTATALEAAVVSAEEGTDSGTTWRQTSVNITLDTDPVLWTNFSASAPAASEATAGVAEIATQAEVDAGTDDARFVTPSKLRSYSLLPLSKKFTIGDGSATSFTCTHNFNTLDVVVAIVEASGNRRSVEAEVRRTSVNAITVLAAPAPTANSLVVYVTQVAVIA